MDVFILVTIIVVLIILILFYLSIFLLTKRKTLSYKEERKLRSELYKLVEKKARLLAKRRKLREEVEYGQLRKEVYDEWEKKFQKKMEGIDEKIDEILDRLAEPYVEIFYEKEKIGVEERKRHIVLLQKKLSQLVEELEKVKRERDDLEKKVRALEYEVEQRRERVIENPLVNALLEKYGDLIKEKEGDIGKWIDVKEKSVKDVAKIGDIPEIYDFIMKTVKTVRALPVKFCIVNKILEYGYADPLNKGVFFLSVIKAKGEKGKLIVGLLDGEERVYVFCQGKYYDMVERNVLENLPEGFKKSVVVD